MEESVHYTMLRAGAPGGPRASLAGLLETPRPPIGVV